MIFTDKPGYRNQLPSGVKTDALKSSLSINLCNLLAAPLQRVLFPLRSEAFRAARSDVGCLRGEGSLRPRGVAPGGMGEARSDSGGIEKGVSPFGAVG